MKYQVHYNRSCFHCDTLAEAETLAKELVDPSHPWSAKIIEEEEEDEV